MSIPFNKLIGAVGEDVFYEKYKDKRHFVIKSNTKIHGAPVNDEGELAPINKLLIDPIQYFKQKYRLNQ